MYGYPYIRPSIFSRGLNLAKGINWANLLDGTQKTLGVINQAIPIIYQVKPVISNAKTIFKIADTLRNNNTNNNNSTNKETQETTTPSNENKPIFYI